MLPILPASSSAISCDRAGGFRQEDPDGRKDFILVGEIQSEYVPQPETARAAGEPGAATDPPGSGLTLGGHPTPSGWHALPSDPGGQLTP
jgi:hypothetical protein